MPPFKELPNLPLIQRPYHPPQTFQQFHQPPYPVQQLQHQIPALIVGTFTASGILRHSWNCATYLRQCPFVSNRIAPGRNKHHPSLIWNSSLTFQRRVKRQLFSFKITHYMTNFLHGSSFHCLIYYVSCKNASLHETQWLQGRIVISLSWSEANYFLAIEVEVPIVNFLLNTEAIWITPWTLWLSSLNLRLEQEGVSTGGVMLFRTCEKK